MLDAPKGLKYWIEDSDGNQTIVDNAPKWAKKEFQEYEEIMNKNGKPDPKTGIVINY